MAGLASALLCPALPRVLAAEPLPTPGALCSPCRQAWDLAVDICLSQLPTIIEEGTAFRVRPPRPL